MKWLGLALHLGSLTALVYVVYLVFTFHPEMGFGVLVYFTCRAASMTLGVHGS